MTNSCGIIAHAQRCLTWRCRSVKKSPCNDFDWAHEFSKQPTSSGVVKREKHCHSSQVTFWKFPHRNIICNIPPYIMHFSQLFSSLQRWSFWHRSAETCTAICAKRGGENDGRWNKKKRSEWMTKWLLTWWYGWEMMLMVERANERTGRSNRNADVHEHKQFFIVHMGFSPTTLFWLHFKKHT